MKNEYTPHKKFMIHAWMRWLAGMVSFCLIVTQLELSWAQRVLEAPSMEEMMQGEESDKKGLSQHSEAKSTAGYMTNMEEFFVEAQKVKYKELMEQFKQKVEQKQQEEKVQHTVSMEVQQTKEARFDAYRELNMTAQRAQGNVSQMASIALPFNYFPNKNDGGITWFKNNLPYMVLNQKLQGGMYKNTYMTYYEGSKLLKSIVWEIVTKDGKVIKRGEQTNIQWRAGSVHYANSKTNATKAMVSYTEVVTDLLTGVKETIKYQAVEFDAKGRATSYVLEIRSSATPDKVTTQTYTNVTYYDENMGEMVSGYFMEEKVFGKNKKGEVVLDYTLKYTRKNIQYTFLMDKWLVSGYEEVMIDQYGKEIRTKYEARYTNEALLRQEYVQKRTIGRDKNGKIILDTTETNIKDNIMYDDSEIYMVAYTFKYIDKNGKVSEGVWDATPDGRLIKAVMAGKNGGAIGYIKKGKPGDSKEKNWTGYVWGEIVKKEDGTEEIKDPKAIIDYGIEVVEEKGVKKYYRLVKQADGTYKKVEISGYEVEVEVDSKGAITGLYRKYMIQEDGKLVQKRERIEMQPKEKIDVTFEKVNYKDLPKEVQQADSPYTGYARKVVVTREYEGGQVKTETKYIPIYDVDMLVKYVLTQRAKDCQKQVGQLTELIKGMDALVNKWTKEYHHAEQGDASHGGQGTISLEEYLQKRFTEYLLNIKDGIIGSSSSKIKDIYADVILLFYSLLDQKYGQSVQKAWDKLTSAQKQAYGNDIKKFRETYYANTISVHESIAVLKQALQAGKKEREKYVDEKTYQYFKLTWSKELGRYLETEVKDYKIIQENDGSGNTRFYREYTLNGKQYKEEIYATRNAQDGQRQYGYNSQGQLLGYRQYTQMRDKDGNAIGTKYEDFYNMTYDENNNNTGMSGQVIEQGKVQYIEEYGVKYNGLGQRIEMYRISTDMDGKNHYEHRFDMEYDKNGADKGFKIDATTDNARQYIERSKMKYNELGQLIEYYEYNTNPLDSPIMGQGATESHRYDMKYNLKGDITDYKEEGAYHRNPYKMFEEQDTQNSKGGIPNTGYGTYTLTWNGVYDADGNLIKATTVRHDDQNQWEGLPKTFPPDHPFWHKKMSGHGYSTSPVDTKIVEEYVYEKGRLIRTIRNFNQTQTQIYTKFIRVKYKGGIFGSKTKYKWLWVKLKQTWTIDTTDVWEGRYDDQTGNLIGYKSEHKESIKFKDPIILERQKWKPSTPWYQSIFKFVVTLVVAVLAIALAVFTLGASIVGLVAGFANLAAVTFAATITILDELKMKSSFAENQSLRLKEVARGYSYEVVTCSDVSYILDEWGRISKMYRKDEKILNNSEVAVTESVIEYKYGEDGQVTDMYTDKHELLKDMKGNILIDRILKLHRQYFEYDQYHRAVRWIDTITDKWGTYTTERLKTQFNEYGQEVGTLEITIKPVQGKMMTTRVFTEKAYDAKGRVNSEKSRTIQVRLEDGDMQESLAEQEIEYYENGPFANMPSAYNQKGKNVTLGYDWQKSKAKQIFYNALGLTSTLLMHTYDSKGKDMWVKWFYFYNQDGQKIKEISETIEETSGKKSGLGANSGTQKSHTEVYYYYKGRDLIEVKTYTYFEGKSGFGIFGSKSSGYNFKHTRIDEWGESHTIAEYKHVHNHSGFFGTVFGQVIKGIFTFIVGVIGAILSPFTFGLSAVLAAAVIFTFNCMTTYLSTGALSLESVGLFALMAVASIILSITGAAGWLPGIGDALIAAREAVDGLIQSIMAWAPTGTFLDLIMAFIVTMPLRVLSAILYALGGDKNASLSNPAMAQKFYALAEMTDRIVFLLGEMFARLVGDFVKDIVSRVMAGWDMMESAWFNTGSTTQTLTKEEEEKKIRQQEQGMGWGAMFVGMMAGSFAGDLMVSPLLPGLVIEDFNSTVANRLDMTYGQLFTQFFSPTWFKELTAKMIEAALSASVDYILFLWASAETKENRDLRRYLRTASDEERKRKASLFEYYQQHPVQEKEFLLTSFLNIVLGIVVGNFASDVTETLSSTILMSTVDPEDEISIDAQDVKVLKGVRNFNLSNILINGKAYRVQKDRTYLRYVSTSRVRRDSVQVNKEKREVTYTRMDPSTHLTEEIVLRLDYTQTGKMCASHVLRYQARDEFGMLAQDEGYFEAGQLQYETRFLNLDLAAEASGLAQAVITNPAYGIRKMEIQNPLQCMERVYYTAEGRQDRTERRLAAGRVFVELTNGSLFKGGAETIYTQDRAVVSPQQVVFSLKNGHIDFKKKEAVMQQLTDTSTVLTKYVLSGGTWNIQRKAVTESVMGQVDLNAPCYAQVKAYLATHQIQAIGYNKKETITAADGSELAILYYQDSQVVAIENKEHSTFIIREIVSGEFSDPQGPSGARRYQALDKIFSLNARSLEEPTIMYYADTAAEEELGTDTTRKDPATQQLSMIRRIYSSAEELTTARLRTTMEKAYAELTNAQGRYHAQLVENKPAAEFYSRARYVREYKRTLVANAPQPAFEYQGAYMHLYGVESFIAQEGTTTRTMLKDNRITAILDTEGNIQQYQTDSEDVPIHVPQGISMPDPDARSLSTPARDVPVGRTVVSTPSLQDSPKSVAVTLPMPK